MNIRKKHVVAFLAIDAIIAFLAWQYGAPAYASYQDRKTRQTLQRDARTKDTYPDLLKAEQYVKDHPDDPQGLISTGLVWKTFGEATGERKYFERSRDEFERGAALFGERNTVVLLNAGNLQRMLGNYLRAEELYQQAIRVNPGQGELYLALVDLYRYNLKERGDRAIIDLFRAGLEHVVTNADLVQNLAYYLKDMKRYQDALPYFDLLAQSYPDDPSYPEVIQELREGIARGEDKSTGISTRVVGSGSDVVE